MLWRLSARTSEFGGKAHRAFRCAFLLHADAGSANAGSANAADGDANGASTFGTLALKRAPAFKTCLQERRLAKAKTKAAVSRKAAKTPARPAKALKKVVATKPVKVSAAKPEKAALAKVTVEKSIKKPVAPVALPKAEPLTLPAAKVAPVEAPLAPAAKPVLTARKPTEAAAQRADRPPADGFTLLVDGHFKSCFDDLKGAKAAASELKGRFPMLRVEIYDAAKKARLPA